jgi:hypothetical protein
MDEVFAHGVRKGQAAEPDLVKGHNVGGYDHIHIEAGVFEDTETSLGSISSQ